MKRIAIAGLVLAAAAATNGLAQSQSIRDQFVGLYTLVEYAPHGDQPTGRIYYDAAGRMSAMLLPSGRTPAGRGATLEEYRASMSGVITYYGTYTIDEEGGRVIHHLEAASNPSWIGDDFVRWYRFEGNRLTLSLSPEFTTTLVWERMPDE